MTEEFTSMGTPWAASWDEEWAQVVGAEERSLNRRICGGKLNSGEPCRMKGDHPNGRCRFHGGFAATGGAEGNRNAVQHGLYARGLQRCGEHCSMWKHCPIANKEILALPEKHRPECPYEVQHYELSATEAIERGEKDMASVHLVAMLGVMMMRAAAAMSISPLWVENAKGIAEKVHPALEAFRRMSGEYRRSLDARRAEKKLQQRPAEGGRSRSRDAAACDVKCPMEGYEFHVPPHDGEMCVTAPGGTGEIAGEEDCPPAGIPENGNGSRDPEATPPAEPGVVKGRPLPTGEFEWPKANGERRRWRELRQNIRDARTVLGVREQTAAEDEAKYGGTTEGTVESVVKLRNIVRAYEGEARHTGVPVPLRR